MWRNLPAPVVPYAILLGLFVDGRVSGEEFEILYVTVYKSDATSLSSASLEVLDGLFFDLEDFDGGHRTDARSISESELHGRVQVALNRLMSIPQ